MRRIASRMLAGVVNDADPATRAVIFRRPELLTGTPRAFVPRALHLERHDLRQKLRLAPAGSAVLFAVDASGSMGFGLGTMSKYEYSQRAALCLARLVLHQRDAAGLAIIGGGVE